MKTRPVQKFKCDNCDKVKADVYWDEDLGEARCTECLENTETELMTVDNVKHTGKFSKGRQGNDEFLRNRDAAILVDYKTMSIKALAAKYDLSKSRIRKIVKATTPKTLREEAIEYLESVIPGKWDEENVRMAMAEIRRDNSIMRHLERKGP